MAGVGCLQSDYQSQLITDKMTRVFALKFIHNLLNVAIFIDNLTGYTLLAWFRILSMSIQPEHSTLVLLPPRVRGIQTSKFKPIKLITNHYFVSMQPMKKIFIFSVRFNPFIPQDNTHLRTKLLADKHDQIKKQIPSPIYSGMNIYSTQTPSQTEKDYNCGQYTIKVKQVKIYDLVENPKLLLAFLNNGLRNMMSKLNFLEIGRSGKYFNSSQKTGIDNLIMYNGYKSNFVRLEKGYFLRVDPAKKIVRNQTVLEFMDELYMIHKDKDKAEKRNTLKANLIDKIVMSNYGKTQYYQINDIEFIDLTLVVIDQKTSLLQYYEQKYKIKLKNLKQPLLVTTMKNKDRSIYLIPELMLMTGIPDNFDEMRRKKISEQTIKAPSEKLKEIQGLMNRLKDAKQLKALEEIGLKLSTKVEKADAKQIPTPMLELGKKNTVQRGKESFFNLFSKPIYSGKHEIVCKIIHSRNADVNQLISVFQKTSVNLGVSLNVSAILLNAPNIGAIEKEVRRAIDGGAKICCIVLPISMKNNYKNIKMMTLQKEIVTQIVTEATLRKKNLQSIATKVLLQIIAKRGNILWVPKMSFELQFSGMLVAFDQCKIGNKTLLAICATINSTFTLVYTCTKVFEGLENKYQAMHLLLCNALKSFHERNKGVPEEIICFQNSCTGDQVSSYHQLFVQPALKSIRQAYSSSNLAFTFIMINVKTNERFFMEMGGKINNVVAGTLVCQGLVSQNYDFYIVSQQSTRGTTVPNHYKVIYSDSKLEEGILQEISFSQCFNYVNWTGSIKVPAILQYAKKAAKFGSQVLSDMEVPESLHTKLYFVQLLQHQSAGFILQINMSALSDLSI